MGGWDSVTGRRCCICLRARRMAARRCIESYGEGTALPPRISSPAAAGQTCFCAHRKNGKGYPLTRSYDGEMVPDMARKALPSSPRKRSSTLMGVSSAMVNDTMARAVCEGNVCH